MDEWIHSDLYKSWPLTLDSGPIYFVFSAALDSCKNATKITDRKITQIPKVAKRQNALMCVVIFSTVSFSVVGAGLFLIFIVS